MIVRKPKQQSASTESPKTRDTVNQDNAKSISSTSFIDETAVLANVDEPFRNGFLQIVKVSVSNGKQTQTTLALLASGSNILYVDAKDKSDLKLKGQKSPLNVCGFHGPAEIPGEIFVAEAKAAVEGNEKFKVFVRFHPKITLASNEYNFREMKAKCS